MDEFVELLPVDHKRALEFFVSELIDVLDGRIVSRVQLLYNASVLAHYSQVSTENVLDMPTPRDLRDVLDRFIFENHIPTGDPELLEISGAQTLFVTGFFGDQMFAGHRYNLRWCNEIWAGFYHKASQCSESPKKRELLGEIAVSFSYWVGVYRKLGRALRRNQEDRFLLRLN